MNDWVEVTVEDIKASSPNALATGPFGSSISSRFFQKSGVPVIRGSNLSEDIGTRLIPENMVFISPEKAKEFERSIVRPGDLIFTCWGTIGQVGLISKNTTFREYVISNKQMKLTPDPNRADSLFLYYLFSSPKIFTRIQKQAIGSSVPGFNLGQLRSLKLHLPSLKEQQAVAHILGSLDDKIELNRQMNETLEGIARALFKSWFVDFDPIHAKMEGRQPYGMDAETAALFPDGFEDSKLGEIPRGWKVTTLGNVTALNETVLNKDFSFGEIEYVDISSVSIGKLEKTTRYTLANAPSRAKRQVRHGDTIWSTVRPNRKSYLFICKPQDNLVVSTGFVVLSPKSIPPTYLYSWVTTDQFVDYLTYSADGSAYPAVLPSRFSSAKMFLPNSRILQKFEQLIAPIYSHIFQNNEESQTLSTLRDTLLPKLLSGEIRIKQAEKEAGAIL